MDFDLRFTDKEITAWGGMALMKRMLDHLQFEQALAQAGLPEPGSNRGYAPTQLITQFMLSVWCGASRKPPPFDGLCRRDQHDRQLLAAPRQRNQCQ
jgi:hypothetical protein